MVFLGEKPEVVEILRRRFVDGATLKDIAADHGVSHVAVLKRIRRAVIRISKRGYPVLNMSQIPCPSPIPAHESEGDSVLRDSEGRIIGYDDPIVWCGGTGREVTPDNPPLGYEYRKSRCPRPAIDPSRVYGVKAKKRNISTGPAARSTSTPGAV